MILACLRRRERIVGDLAEVAPARAEDDRPHTACVFALSVVSNRAGSPGDDHLSVLDRVRSRGDVVARVLDHVLGTFAAEALS